MKSIYGDIHVHALTERPQSVEDPALVGELQVLQEGHVHIEPHQLNPDAPVARAVGQDKQDAAGKRGHKMVQAPPALDSRPIHLEDGLADGQRAVVPHGQEVEEQVQHSIAQGEAEDGQHEGNQVDDELESLVLILVVVLGLLVQDADVDIAQDDLKIATGLAREAVLHLAKLSLSAQYVFVQVDHLALFHGVLGADARHLSVSGEGGKHERHDQTPTFSSPSQHT